MIWYDIYIILNSNIHFRPSGIFPAIGSWWFNLRGRFNGTSRKGIRLNWSDLFLLLMRSWMKDVEGNIWRKLSCWNVSSMGFNAYIHFPKQSIDSTNFSFSLRMGEFFVFHLCFSSRKLWRVSSCGYNSITIINHPPNIP